MDNGCINHHLLKCFVCIIILSLYFVVMKKQNESFFFQVSADSLLKKLIMMESNNKKNYVCEFVCVLKETFRFLSFLIFFVVLI